MAVIYSIARLFFAQCFEGGAVADNSFVCPVPQLFIGVGRIFDWRKLKHGHGTFNHHECFALFCPLGYLAGVLP